MAKAGYNRSDWDEVVAEEWTVDYTASLYYFINHFEIGAGLQWMNPYVTVGFASDHFGLMGWTDWRILAGFKSVGAGVNVIEQISPTPKMQLGLLQFISQSFGYYAAGDDWVTGYKTEYSPEGEPMESIDPSCYEDSTGCTWETHKGIREAYPYGFREVGAGAYVLYSIQEKLRLGFEFRFSYDWTYKTNRLAFSFGLSM